MSAILLTHNAEQNLDLQYHLILTVAIKKKVTGIWPNKPNNVYTKMDLITVQFKI